MPGFGKKNRITTIGGIDFMAAVEGSGDFYVAHVGNPHNNTLILKGLLNLHRSAEMAITDSENAVKAGLNLERVLTQMFRIWRNAYDVRNAPVVRECEELLRSLEAQYANSAIVTTRSRIVQYRKGRPDRC